MPTATRRKRNTKSEPETIEGQAREVATVAAEEEIPIPLTPAEMEAAGIEFFPMLQKLAPAMWEDSIVYLYRLAPKVEAIGGAKKFICKYTMPFDEATVQQDHGGGKYKAIFRYTPKGVDFERSLSFDVEGEPKIAPTHKLVENPAAPTTAATSVDSDGKLITLIGTVLEKIQNKPQEEAVRIAVDTLKSAMAGAMDVVTTAAKQSVTATPATSPLETMAMTLLTKLVSGEPIGPRNSLQDKLLDAALKKFLSDEPAPQPNPAADPVDSLARIKDAFGLDLPSLLKGASTAAAGKNVWIEKLVDSGSLLVQNLPNLFAQWRQMRAEDFQRQMEILRVRAMYPQLQPGAPTPTPQPGAVPSSPLPANFAAPGAVPPPVAAQPQPTQPAAAAEPAPATQQIPAETLMNIEMNNAIAAISECYEQDDTGEECALTLERAFPRVVQFLRPQLADPNNVKLVCSMYFGKYLGDDEFQPFINDLVKTLLSPPQPEAAPDAPAPGETQPA